jgi:antitoxin YefM
MSIEDETSYLLRNPRGAQRLVDALARARRGEFEEHGMSETLSEPEPREDRE